MTYSFGFSINVILRPAARSLQTPPDRPGYQITPSLGNIKETNKRAEEHICQGSIELTLAAEHLWDNFKYLTMPGAGTASDYYGNCLQWLL